MLVSPLPNWVILLGYVTGAVARGLVVGVLVLLIALFFTSLHVVHPVLTFFSVLLGATIFSLAGFINAVYARKFDDVAIVPTFILLGSAILATLGLIAGISADKFDQLAAFQNFIIVPLTFLSGVFYSIHSLPPFWQTLSHFNPFFYMIDGFRYGFFGLSDVAPARSLAVVAGCAVALVVFALSLLVRGWKLRLCSLGASLGHTRFHPRVHRRRPRVPPHRGAR